MQDRAEEGETLYYQQKESKIQTASRLIKTNSIMARIAGIDLPRNKRGIISLQYIYGIGATRAKNILEQASISEQVKVQDWTDDNVMVISSSCRILNIKQVIRVRVLTIIL